MTYSSAGILALIIHLVINHDVLRKNEGNKIIPAYRAYRAFLLVVGIYYVADALWGVLYDRQLLSLTFADTVIYFVAMALTILFWMYFVVEYLDIQGQNGRITMIIGNCFFAFQIAVLIINFFFPIVFYFDSAGVYHAGIARYINLAIQIFLFVLAAVSAFIAASKSTGAKKHRRRAVGLFSLIMAGFVLTQVLFPLLPLYAIGCLISSCMLHSFVLENVREEYRGDLEEQLHESEEKGSKYDRLTGLPNMTYFYELSEHDRHVILSKDDLPAMLYMDFGGMKFFNTKHGFAEGDKLLKRFAEILVETFGEEYCCRIYGDHFAAVCARSEAEDNIERLIAECKNIHSLQPLPLHVGIYTDEKGDASASAACDRAKLACNQLRGSYDSGFKYYDKELDEDIENRQYIVENIDRALKEKWITAHYQAIVRATNHKVCEEEALARWNDPDRGMLSPAEFIPALEDSGQIYKLDLYMLEETLDKIRRQDELGIYSVPHSLNISRSDFDACDIVEEISRRVDEAGVDHDRITIELTESTVGRDSDFIKEQIERFKAQGFPVWMDDFGSGYSSLEMLQNFDFDVIKFDMGFLRKLDEGDNGKIILTELMQMATALGVGTVCEGVETEEQAAFLKEIGCSRLQGYLFTKPVPFEEILDRNEKGTQIGNENTEETAYYDAISRANLYDLSSVVSEEEGTLFDYFDTLPMGVLEVNGDKVRYLRSNKSYREFLIRHFNRDITVEETDISKPSEMHSHEFIQAVRQSCSTGERIFFDEALADGTMAHSFIRRIARNPVTGKTALAVAVLSVSDPDEGASYAEIARALATDYYNIYVVDLDTDEFIEYTSPSDQNELAEERHGKDFFESAKVETMLRIYEEDREQFLKWFTKDNIVNEIDKHGAFTSTYRLVDTGAPVYVNMKITRMAPGSNRIILGVSIVDSQMKQKEEYEKAQKERLVLARLMALSEGYVVVYLVDPETDNYIEYNSSGEFHELGIAQRGEDFFNQSLKNGKKLVYPEDLPLYLSQFNKDNVMRKIRNQGRFVLRYRLNINGEVKPVSLRIAESHEEGKVRLIAGVREAND